MSYLYENIDIKENNHSDARITGLLIIKFQKGFIAESFTQEKGRKKKKKKHKEDWMPKL